MPSGNGTGNIGKGSDFGERLAFCRGTLDHDLAALEDDVLRRGFEQSTSKLRHLRPHLGAGHVQRRAADRLRPAAERPDALFHDRRVAVMDRDVLDRHAELIGKHLPERRFVTLPVRRGASRCADAAVAFDGYLRVLPPARGQSGRRTNSAHFDVHRQTEADQPSLLCESRCSLRGPSNRKP